MAKGRLDKAAAKGEGNYPGGYAPGDEVERRKIKVKSKRKFNSDLHHRRSIRLPCYDYSTPGAYFITLCTHEKKMLFENTVCQKTINKIWEELPEHLLNIKLDTFVIMPNHIHGIICIIEHCRGEVTSPLRRYTLGQTVAYFKYETTKLINKISNTPARKIWQRNYYERVLRNDEELNRAREYVINNTIKWHLDRENPLRTGNDDDSWLYTKNL